jgi:hypothetical protein
LIAVDELPPVPRGGKSGDLAFDLKEQASDFGITGIVRVPL